MSIEAIVTRGFGSFATVNDLPTRGFSTGVVTPSQTFPPGGGRYIAWTPEPQRKKRQPKKTNLKRLLRKVAIDDSTIARERLERQARDAADAALMMRDIRLAVRELEKEFSTKARELEITHQWAEKLIRRIEDEKLILFLLLEEA